MTVEVLDHTADVGLLVRAGNPAEAFAALVEGMFDIIVHRPTVRPDRVWTIEVAAPDWPDLVIAFVEELLYRFESQGLLLNSCRITDIGPDHLTAEIGGEQVDTKRHELRVQIKAVTYHQLRAIESPEGFEIQVIFDI